MKKKFLFSANPSKKDKDAFNDAIPIGNGHLGAMIYGDPFHEKLILNENTFWLGKKDRVRYAPSFYEHYKKVQEYVLNGRVLEAEALAQYTLFPNPKQEAIYTVGGQLNLQILHPEEVEYERSLDLDQGIVEVITKGGKNTIKRTYFASYPKDILVIHIEAEQELEAIVSLDREKLVDAIYASRNELYLKASFNQEDEFHIRLQAQASTILELGASLYLKGKDIVLYLSMATTLYTSDLAAYEKRIFQDLEDLNITEIQKEAILDYQTLYQRQEFTCNDLEMTYMYQLSRYLMISSSRKNLPCNLQGLWNQDYFPAWDSKFTININLQMNYWNVFSANLKECFSPLLRLIEKMYPNGKKLAMDMYHVDGFVAHHNTDFYGDCGLQDHYLPATLWPLGAAWLTLFIYEAYAYSKDVQILKQYGYLLIEAAKFISSMLILDSNGYYILCPSLSPENSYMQKEALCHFSKGCVMDDEIIYDLFHKTIVTNEILQINEDMNQRLKEQLRHLYPFQKNQYGALCEWHEDFIEVEPGHRHISHLYGLYPSNQIKEGTKAFEYAKVTLKRRLEHGGGHTGWSKAWITALYARLKDGCHAYQSFKEFYKNSTSKIGLDLHPPFQIDGNFGIAAAIKEMLLYEEEGYIEIFPAKPKEITELCFTHIPIKGNISLSLWLKQNQLSYEIEVQEETTLQIHYKGASKQLHLTKGIHRFTE